jgi:hypothetical protein
MPCMSRCQHRNGDEDIEEYEYVSYLTYDMY